MPQRQTHLITFLLLFTIVFPTVLAWNAKCLIPSLLIIHKELFVSEKRVATLLIFLSLLLFTYAITFSWEPNLTFRLILLFYFSVTMHANKRQLDTQFPDGHGRCSK